MLPSSPPYGPRLYVCDGCSEARLDVEIGANDVGALRPELQTAGWTLRKSLAIDGWELICAHCASVHSTPSLRLEREYEAAQRWFVERGGKMVRRTFGGIERVSLMLPEGETSELVLGDAEGRAFAEGFVRAVATIKGELAGARRRA